MDKVASLRTFVKVVDTRSFAEAGRQLRLSRSAVSKYVAELEQSPGGTASQSHDASRQSQRARANVFRARARSSFRDRRG